MVLSIAIRVFLIFVINYKHNNKNVIIYNKYKKAAGSGTSGTNIEF